MNHAAKRLLPALLCAAAVLAPAAPAFGITFAERQMVELTNRYRASWGLSRLKISPHLQNAAEWFAADKAQTGSFDQSHYDSLGRYPDERFADFDYPPGDGWTENLAAGSADPFEILEAWRQSPAHDANLRRRDARVVGIGLATNPETGIAVWVADYAVHIGSARDPSTGSATAATVRATGCPTRGRQVVCRPGAVVTLTPRGLSGHTYLAIDRRRGNRWVSDAAHPRAARLRVSEGFVARVRVLAPGRRGRAAAAARWLTVTAR